MADRIGQQLGKYRLIRLLGTGGFAEVYLGEHLRLGTQVAIKVLHTSLDEDGTEGFLREAQMVAHLRHPHIVRVFDFDVEDRTPFLVMDYLPNGNVRGLYPKGTPLPMPSIIFYVNQVASALQYAHEAKLIHRDVKPENMLLDQDQTLALSDFGIAIMSQSSRYHNPQEVAGTAAYMAPEQFQGQPRRASDQYALGIVVYEWLSGDRPFHGSFTEIASQHLFVPPPSLHEKVPTISPDVEQVVFTALEKEPQKRFASIQAFATALAQASRAVPVFPVASPTLPPSIPHLSEEPVIQNAASSHTDLPLPSRTQLPSPLHETTSKPLSTPVTPPSTAPDTGITRQRRLCWGKAAFLVALVLVVIGSASFFYMKAGNQNGTTQSTTPATANAQATSKAHTKATAAAQTNAGATATTVAAPTMTATTAANAYNAAVAAQGVMFGFDVQHTHVNPYEAVLTSSNIARLAKTWTYPISRDAFYLIPSSPVVANGVLYIGAEDHILYALDARSGTLLWHFQTGSVIISTPAVANGMVYVGSLDGTLYALDARSGTLVWHFTSRNGIRSSPALVNGMVYVGSRDGILYALDAHAGTLVWSYQTGGEIWSSPAVANGMVYVGSFDHSFYAVDARSGTPVWSYRTGNYILSSPAVANGMVYIGSEDHMLYAFDALSGAVQWSYLTGNDVDSSPAVANGVVFVGSRDNSLYAFDARSGNLLWHYASGNSIFSPPTVANGIVYVGSEDHVLYALDVHSGRPVWSYRTGSGIVSCPAIVNGFVYVGSDDNTLYAFHVPGGSS